MNLLLDTHVWIWGLLDPGRIPAALRARLVEESTSLWLSPISVWEATLLAERGRIAVPGSPHAWVEAALNAGPWQEAPLTHRVAIESRRLRVASPDPADRFLLATAKVHHLTLVTADRSLAKAPGLSVLSFRPTAVR